MRAIRDQGHEIACHGYAHQLIYKQTKEEFREDIRKAKAILEDITGSEVTGYRAPTYSITDQSLWALRILAEEGFTYDSSIFPIRHDLYGIPSAPRFPFLIHFDADDQFRFLPLPLLQHCNAAEPQHAPLGLPQHGSIAAPQHFLYEFPLSTVRFLNMNFPISGGGYFRLFPYSFIKWGLKRINRKEEAPFIFYLHPWELDSEQPRVRGASLRSRVRHYTNLSKTEEKLRRLFSSFHFFSIGDFLRSNQFVI